MTIGFRAGKKRPVYVEKVDFFLVIKNYRANFVGLKSKP